MDFIGKALAQLRELFLSMTPGARITTALLLAMVVVSFGYLFHLQTGGPNSLLMGGESFSADRLRLMEAAFARANLSGYRIDGSRIRVPSDEHAAYMGALADGDALPPSFGTYLDEALNRESFFDNKQTREQRILVAKQKELSRIMRTMRDVEEASVLYDRQKAKGLSMQDIVTASVGLKTASGQPIDPDRVRMIKKMVAATFAGMAPERVAVTDLSGDAVYASTGEDGAIDAGDDPYYNLKARYEESLEEKIHQLLAYVPGIQVEVHAELDKELRRREQRVNLDPKLATALQTRVETRTSVNEQGPPAGRPGLEAQGPSAGPASVASARSTTSEEKTRNEETQNFLPQEQVLVDYKGLTPSRVRASIALPSSYYLSVYRERNRQPDGTEPPPPTQQQIDDLESLLKESIQNAVLAILPTPPDGVEAISQVTVTSFQSLTPDPVEPPSFADQAIAWTSQSWSTLGMFALSIVGLVFLRSMIKSASTSAAAGTPRLAALLEEESEAKATLDETNTAGPSRPKRRFSKRPNVKEELADMVRDDPDAAASILRTWIANAG
jgi:flagellar M-ring protein FliF